MNRGESADHRAVYRVLLAGVAVTAALAALMGLLRRVPWAPQWADPESAVHQYFDLSREQNLPTWVNVMVLSGAAALCALAAGCARAAGDRAAWPWAGVGVAMAGLSLDDMTALHERLDGLGRALGGGSGLTYAAWVVPGLAVAAVLAGLVGLLVRRVDGLTRGLLLAGLGLLVVAAFGIEAVGNAVLEDRGRVRTYALSILVEESLELVAAWLLLAAPLSALAIRRTGDGFTLRYRRPAGRVTSSGSPAPSSADRNAAC